MRLPPVRSTALRFFYKDYTVLLLPDDYSYLLPGLRIQAWIQGLITCVWVKKGVVWEIRVMNAEAKTVVTRGRKLPQVLKERRAAVQSMRVGKNPDIR